MVNDDGGVGSNSYTTELGVQNVGSMGKTELVGEELGEVESFIDNDQVGETLNNTGLKLRSLQGRSSRSEATGGSNYQVNLVRAVSIKIPVHVDTGLNSRESQTLDAVIETGAEVSVISHDWYIELTTKPELWQSEKGLTVAERDRHMESTGVVLVMVTPSVPISTQVVLTFNDK